MIGAPSENRVVSIDEPEHLDVLRLNVPQIVQIVGLAVHHDRGQIPPHPAWPEPLRAQAATANVIRNSDGYLSVRMLWGSPFLAAGGRERLVNRTYVLIRSYVSRYVQATQILPAAQGNLPAL